MAIIRGRQMGLDMPTLSNIIRRRQNYCEDEQKKSPADKHGYQLRAEGLIWSSGVQGHCQKTSAPRFTLQKAPGEKANDFGEEPFSSTEYLMICTDGVTLVRRPGDKRNDPKYQVPTVKHGGGNVMMWGCFHANGAGSLIRIAGTMESYMYKDILDKEMLSSGRSQMGRGWLFQQDNNPKHSSHFFKDWIAQHRVNVMAWPSQSPDLNPFTLTNLIESMPKDVRPLSKPKTWRLSIKLIESF
uniref:Tc1-like transposase DDE domain-containing protein n=1 Tax=Caenorhabditis japonica TaxID=281687 RepID=A0A8R1E5W8_CAEJA